MLAVKKKLSILLSLILAVVVVSAFSVSPALAEAKTSEMTPIEKAKAEKKLGAGNTEGDPYETGIGVHADPEVFEKDFSLTREQKIYTIQEMERVVSEITDPGMSDLEKYYELAKWVNKHVEYDWDFWGGRYYFEYYSHQWDSYGGMKEDEKSVCAGIAIFYASMCHAAGLPCKFVRLDPTFLDHTVNYIPDINGHAYLVDVTENVFLMSEQSSSAFPHLDKEFSNITKDADDETFDYSTGEEGDLISSTIKDYYDTPFEVWFNEFAWHKNTEKDFRTPYEEKGSGTPGTNHAPYTKYDSNRTAKGDIWFLDDFYKNHAELKQEIMHGEFDEELLNVSGVKKNYDCDNLTDLQAAVEDDIAVDYFPSKSDSNKIVAEVDTLEKGIDFEVTCSDLDTETKKAVVTVEGKGKYVGAYQFTVKLHSAVVTKDPVPKKRLVYKGIPQALIEPGEAENGEIQYALGTKEEPTEEFSTTVPTATNAGKYYVWYKVVGDDSHENNDPPQRMENNALIAKLPVRVLVDEDCLYLKKGETATISPKLDAKISANFLFASSNEEIVTVDDNGVVTAVAGGSTSIYIETILQGDSSNYDIEDYMIVWVDVEPEPFDLSETKVRFNKSSFTYNGKVQRPTIKTIKGFTLEEGTDYTVKWSDKSSKKAGTYKVVVTGKGAYTGSTDATYTIKKAANPMKLKAKKVAVKAKSLRKKSKSIARYKALKIRKARGKLSYRITSAKKGKSKKNYKKKFKINAKTGKITVKKGLKRGTYRVTVKVKAKGTANYKASAWKAVKVKVLVK